MREAQIISVFGKVSYKRAYYAGCECQKGKAPLDEQYGLESGAVSSGLAQLLGLAGIGFSFEESEKWLAEFLLFDISENSIRSETEGLRLIQEQEDEKAVDWYHAEDHLKKLADAIFVAQSDRLAWLNPVTEMLWQGQLEMWPGL